MPSCGMVKRRIRVHHPPGLIGPIPGASRFSSDGVPSNKRTGPRYRSRGHRGFITARCDLIHGSCDPQHTTPRSQRAPWSHCGLGIVIVIAQHRITNSQLPWHWHFGRLQSINPGPPQPAIRQKPRLAPCPREAVGTGPALIAG